MPLKCGNFLELFQMIYMYMNIQIMTSYLSFAHLPQHMLAQSCGKHALSPYQIHYGALNLLGTSHIIDR